MAIPRLRTRDGSSYCSNCNAPVEDIALGCPKCGQSFFGVKDALLCKYCNSANLIGSISCAHCGKMLEEKGVKPVKKESQPEEEQPAKVAPRPVSPKPIPPKPGVKKGGEKAKKEELEEAKRRTQSLWELSEPFEKVIRSRRRRLAKINYLLERAKERLSTLEENNAPEYEKERERLKDQIAEIMNEKEEIINIEEGIAEMERIYRNLLSLQETELEKKQEALRNRLQSFENEMQKWNKERSSLKSREQQLTAREREIQRKLSEIQNKETDLANREIELKDKMRDLRKEELEIMKMKFTGDTSKLESRKGWVEGEDGKAEVMETGPDLEKANEMIDQLQKKLDEVSGEKSKLEDMNTTYSERQEDIRQILKILDDLLERLSDEDIKKFANSEHFKLYEKVLDSLEL